MRDNARVATIHPRASVRVASARRSSGSLLFPAALLVAVVCAHVVASPFTKVEESWTLHAVHDALAHGFGAGLSSWDHVANPGPVPRSFVGPLWLAAASYSPVQLWRYIKTAIGWSSRDALDTQIVGSLVFLAHRMRLRWGQPIAARFLVLCAFSFHLSFWAGRTVPNMTAFPFTQVALALSLFPSSRLVRSRSRADVLAGAAILTATAAVLRAELAALLLPLSLQIVALRYATVTHLMVTGVVAGVVSLGTYASLPTHLTYSGLSVPLDSWLWRQWPLWPELQGLLFNVVAGKSADWGTSVWHAYFTRFLPRLLHVWLPLTLHAFLTDSRSRQVALPAFASLGLLSCLGHKEWRFAIYALPLLMIAALRGEEQTRLPLRRWCRRRGLPFVSVYQLGLSATALLTIASSVVSHFNYPGGIAMRKLSLMAQHRDGRPLDVHLDAFAAMTGASLFTHSPALRVNKTETLRTADDYAAFDALVSHEPELHRERFQRVSGAVGFAGVRRGPPPLTGTLVDRLARFLPVHPAFDEQVSVLVRRDAHATELG